MNCKESRTKKGKIANHLKKKNKHLQLNMR